jgi:hypothetical protein
LERIINRTLKSDELCDHIDGNPLNNRRSNLRISTKSENARNRGKTKRNTSGHKGVYWNHQRSNWRAAIVVNYHKISLGSFSDVEEAAQAYRAAAIKYHGEFAKID